jgi:hypothetical protein
MTQTIPETSKTEELVDIIEWLGGELHSTDTSLLEEWQKLSDPRAALEQEKSQADIPEQEDITKDRRAFVVLLRNVIWRVVKALARQDWDSAAEQMRAAALVDVRVNPEDLASTLGEFFQEYGEMRTDPAARSPRHLQIEDAGNEWTLRQSLVDPEEELGFRLVFDLSLEECREQGRPVLHFREIESG